jgi:glycosyltransferase involved in cell wall biosynthesis
MSERTPKVTVITGAYNRGGAMEPTIRAILNQTFSDFEFIVFDDASSDDTAQRLRALQAELADPRLICIVHEKNKGFTQGMIDAVAMARGEYIAVQGSGDISLPRRLELQAGLLDARPEVGAVGGWYANVVEDKGIRRPRRPNADTATFESLQGENVYSHGEVMFRKSVYDHVGGYRAAFKFCQDIDLWLRMIRVSRLATVKEDIYDRFVRFDGVSYDPKKFAIQARYAILARAFALLPPDEQAKAVAELAEKGPVALVPKSDPDLQKRYFKAALRSIAWGGVREAEQLARDDIEDPLRRYFVIAVARFFGTPFAFPARFAVQRALGIEG